MGAQPLMSVDDVAERLGVDKKRARQIILRLPHVRLGTGPLAMVRILPSELDKFVSRTANAKKHGAREGMRLALYRRQGGKCAICKKAVAYHGMGPACAALDHCHSSGIVRGVLCGSCNQGLGAFKDRPDLLRRAARYVVKWRVAPSQGVQDEAP